MSSNPAQARHDASALPRIRDLNEQGLSLREIAEQLDLDGLPSPRRGKKWNAVAVKRILDRAEDNPASPKRETVHIGGAVNMTGPLTIFATEPVSISGSVNINPPPAAEKIAMPHSATPLILAAPSRLSALCSLSSLPITYTHPLASLDSLPLSPSEAALISDPRRFKGGRR